MKPALLVIDTQKVYLPMMDPRGQETVLYLIKTTIDVFRKFKFPVVNIYHSDLRHGPHPGDATFEFPDDFGVLPEDTRVIKNYGNGFKKTDLDEKLKALGCDTLFICGLSAVGCALATYFGAGDNDYTAFLLKGMLLSDNADNTRVIESAFGAIDIDAMVFMLRNVKWDVK